MLECPTNVDSISRAGRFTCAVVPASSGPRIPAIWNLQRLVSPRHPRTELLRDKMPERAPAEGSRSTPARRWRSAFRAPLGSWGSRLETRKHGHLLRRHPAGRQPLFMVACSSFGLASPSLPGRRRNRHLFQLRDSTAAERSPSARSFRPKPSNGHYKPNGLDDSPKLRRSKVGGATGNFGPGPGQRGLQ